MECQGHCPKCEDKIVLRPMELVFATDYLYYPFTCSNCGYEGREYYRVDYDETIPE